MSHELAGTLDVFVTLLKLAGANSPAAVKLDGYDIAPVLTSGAASPRKEHFWEMFGSRAARFDNWKWVLQGTRSNPPSPDAPGELFDLAADLGEKRDLAKEKPKVLREMKERCDNWMREMARAEPRGPFSRDYFRLLGFPKN
ncbi:MAG: hypothetical protein ABIP55_14950 [Tepidisphaeraceae bacterium]